MYYSTMGTRLNLSSGAAMTAKTGEYKESKAANSIGGASATPQDPVERITRRGSLYPFSFPTE